MEAGERPGRPRAKSPTETPTEVRLAKRRTLLNQTLLLMCALLVVGAAGIAALLLLDHATRPPTSDDIAARICTAYKTQNYSTIIKQVNGTYQGQIGPSGPFDATAQKQLTNTLTNADKRYGKVRTCTPSEVSDNRTQAGEIRTYNLIIQRSPPSQPVTLAVYLVKGSDGSWYITRGSDFGMPPQTAG
jgi:hypothetical protein